MFVPQLSLSTKKPVSLVAHHRENIKAAFCKAASCLHLRERFELCVDVQRKRVQMRKRKVLTSALVLWVALGAAGWFDKEASAQTIRRSTRRVLSPRNAASLLVGRARNFEPYILQAARRYAVDPRALWTIAFLETKFRPELVSPKGARGMMQFMPGTAARFGLINAHDPVAAIEAAARYVRFLSNRYRDNPALIFAAYNAGEGAVDAYLHGITIRLRDGKVINPTGRRTGGVPPYMETISYVSRGLLVMRQVNDLGVFTRHDLAEWRVSVSVLPALNNTSQSDLNNSAPALARAGLVEPSSILSGSIPDARTRIVEAALVPTSIFAREPTGAEVSTKTVAESGASERSDGGVPSSTTATRSAAKAFEIQTSVNESHATPSQATQPLETVTMASRMTGATPTAGETPRIPTSSRARRD